MKKTGLFTLLLTIISLSTYAQITVIPKIGISASRFNTSEIVDQNNSSNSIKINAVSGFTIGAGVQLPITKNGRFSVQPELLFIQKGFETDGSEDGDKFTNTQTHNYLELPLLARVNFGKNKIRSFVILGPSASYMLGGKYKSEIEGFDSFEGKIRFGEEPSNYSGDDLYYADGEARRFDIGLQVGGGVGMNVGPGLLQLEARYGFGFVEFLDDAQVAVENLNTQNRTFTLSLGYAIPLGGK